MPRIGARGLMRDHRQSSTENAGNETVTVSAWHESPNHRRGAGQHGVPSCRRAAWLDVCRVPLLTIQRPMVIYELRRFSALSIMTGHKETKLNGPFLTIVFSSSFSLAFVSISKPLLVVTAHYSVNLLPFAQVNETWRFISNQLVIVSHTAFSAGPAALFTQEP